MHLPLAALAQAWRGGVRTAGAHAAQLRGQRAGGLALGPSAATLARPAWRAPCQSSMQRCAPAQCLPGRAGAQARRQAGPTTLMLLNRASGVDQPHLQPEAHKRCPPSSMRCGGPMRNANASGVPGLHTQTMAEPGDEADIAPMTAPLPASPWRWLAISLAGGLAVAIAWAGAARPPPPVAVRCRLRHRRRLCRSGGVRHCAHRHVTEAPPASRGDRADARRATAAGGRPAAPAPASAAASTIPRRLARRTAARVAQRPAGAQPSAARSIRARRPTGTADRQRQLMHEGESLAPGVTLLEQIKPKAAVLVIPATLRDRLAEN